MEQILILLMPTSLDKFFSLSRKFLKFQLSEVTCSHTEGRRPEYKYIVNNNSRSANKRSPLVFINITRFICLCVCVCLFVCLFVCPVYIKVLGNNKTINKCCISFYLRCLSKKYIIFIKLDQSISNVQNPNFAVLNLSYLIVMLLI